MEGLKRANIRGETNRFEDMKIEFHEKVRKGFSFAYERSRNRCIKIDVSNLDIEELFSIILEKSIAFLKNKE